MGIGALDRKWKGVASRGHPSVSLYKIIFNFIVSERFHVNKGWFLVILILSPLHHFPLRNFN